MDLFLVILFAFTPLALFIGLVIVLAKRASKKSRAPFSMAEMGRTPGFSLLVAHRNETFDMLMYSLLSVAYFQLPFSIPTIASFLNVESSLGSWWTYTIVALLAASYTLYRSVKAFKNLLNNRLGIEAEWAVSNGLAQIEDHSVRVFHDIQGPNFNIDHVLTYPGGVLSIETKGRRKPNSDKNKNTHKLVVDGKILKFPSYEDKETVDQAIRQAKWLSQTLSSSTGMNLKSDPMIVIPGWFIEIKSRPAVPVLNHKNLKKYYRLSSQQKLSESDLSRINHQLELLSRRMSDEF